MKVLGRIGAVIALLASMAWGFYDWVYIDQGPAYFAADWRRVALVVSLSLGGGLIAFLFMRLSAIVRQRLTTAAFGAGVLLTTIYCAYFFGWVIIGTVRIASYLSSKELWIVWSIALGFIALTSFVWFLFLKYWRRISRAKTAA